VRNYVWPFTTDMRRQVVSLRHAGLTVAEIARRMGMEKSSQIRAIQQICESLGRRYGAGDLSTLPPVHRRAGASQ
jgi:transposase-like protein